MEHTGENIMPLVKVKNKFQITIPTKVRDEMHIPVKISLHKYF